MTEQDLNDEQIEESAPEVDSQVSHGLTEADVGEQARQAVQRVIGRLRKKCQQEFGLPGLASHLEDHIHTGSDICYQPPAEDGPDWKF